MLQAPTEIMYTASHQVNLMITFAAQNAHPFLCNNKVHNKAKHHQCSSFWCRQELEFEENVAYKAVPSKPIQAHPAKHTGGQLGSIEEEPEYAIVIHPGAKDKATAPDEQYYDEPDYVI